MIGDILSYTLYMLLPQVLEVIWYLAPIWILILSATIFWQLWVIYVRADDISKREHSLLEVKLPKEQFKSPLAMELVLNTLHERAGAANLFQKYWQGKTRPWYSLEFISIEGDIRFFFWVQKKFKSITEAQIYAQYPDVEVQEVEDYTSFLRYDKEKISLFGTELVLRKKDVYPIKTYIDYGLDKDPKEEYKVDPITPIMEYLGSLGQGEQVWFQIMVRYHKHRMAHKGNLWQKLFTKTTWQEEAKEEVDDILKRDPKTKIPKVEKPTKTGKDEKPSFPLAPTISEGEKEAAKAIERSISKPAFDVGIRGLYLADADKFSGINIPGMIGAWRQYGSENLNSLKPKTPLFKFSYPWQDYKDKRKNRIKIRFFDAYRRRSYFHWPYKGQPFVMNTEELATIFHFPGSVVQTPTFKRIEAKKTEPPSNLPV